MLDLLYMDNMRQAYCYLTTLFETFKTPSSYYFEGTDRSSTKFVEAKIASAMFFNTQRSVSL